MDKDFNDIDHLFQKNQHQLEKEPSDNAWRRLENMLDQTEESVVAKEPAPSSSRFNRRILAAAAFLGILGIAFYLFQSPISDMMEPSQNNTAMASKSVAKKAPQDQRVSRNGQETRDADGLTAQKSELPSRDDKALRSRDAVDLYGDSIEGSPKIAEAEIEKPTNDNRAKKTNPQESPTPPTETKTYVETALAEASSKETAVEKIQKTPTDFDQSEILKDAATVEAPVADYAKEAAPEEAKILSQDEEQREEMAKEALSIADTAPPANEGDDLGKVEPTSSGISTQAQGATGPVAASGMPTTRSASATPMEQTESAKVETDAVYDMDGEAAEMEEEASDNIDGLEEVALVENCWDQNQNGVGDLFEDTNGDNAYNNADCRNVYFDRSYHTYNSGAPARRSQGKDKKKDKDSNFTPFRGNAFYSDLPKLDWLLGEWGNEASLINVSQSEQMLFNLQEFAIDNGTESLKNVFEIEQDATTVILRQEKIEGKTTSYKNYQLIFVDQNKAIFWHIESKPVQSITFVNQGERLLMEYNDEAGIRKVVRSKK